MDKSEERKLIDACLHGDRGSFEPLVRQYQSSVIALAVNILGCGDDAMDIAQETFVQVFINLDRFDPARKFKTWVLGIAVKRCLDHLKKKKTFFKYFQKKTREFRPGEELVHMDHIPLEQSEIFFSLLNKMKDKERVALLLTMNEGYTSREIAGILECSDSTVRVHLYNAKRKLKKSLQNPFREVSG